MSFTSTSVVRSDPRRIQTQGLPIAAAVSSSTIASLPSILLAGLAILIRSELGVSPIGLGSSIAVFFGISGLVSVPAGLFSETVGPKRALVTGAGVTGLSLLGVALTTNSWASFIGWMAVAGFGHSVTQTAANHLLAGRVPPMHQGLAFGIKQSAVPLAGILAGLSVPAIGLAFGWRWGYGAAVFAIPLVLLLVRKIADSKPQRQRPTREGDTPLRILLLLTLTAAVGTCAATCLTTFTVDWAGHNGFSGGIAGLLLTVCSLASLVVRVLTGYLADKIRVGSLTLAGGLAALGAAGLLGLGVIEGAILVVPAFLAFCGAWGYQGLLLLAVARTNMHAPGTAMGIFRLGPATGSVCGPIAFAMIIESVDYSLAWIFAAVLAGAAAILMLLVRQSLTQDMTHGVP